MKTFVEKVNAEKKMYFGSNNTTNKYPEDMEVVQVEALASPPVGHSSGYSDILIWTPILAFFLGLGVPLLIDLITGRIKMAVQLRKKTD